MLSSDLWQKKNNIKNIRENNFVRKKLKIFICIFINFRIKNYKNEKSIGEIVVNFLLCVTDNNNSIS